MGFLERVIHRENSTNQGDVDGFQPTPQERTILEFYLPEGRGGYKGFCQALEWARLSQERERSLLGLYHKEKPKAMRQEAASKGKA